MAEQLTQQPRGIAARTAQFFQRFLRRLHAGFEANGVFDVLPEPLIDGDEKINRARFFCFGNFQPLLFGAPFDFTEKIFADGGKIFGERRRQPAFAVEGREFVIERWIVGEGKFFRLRFEKKIERIQHRHFRDQIHFDAQLPGFFGKDEAGGVIRLRVLNPVDEMIFRRDLERVAQNPRARMRRGPQPHDLRAEVDQPVVLVMRFMVKRDVDGHANL